MSLLSGSFIFLSVLDELASFVCVLTNRCLFLDITLFAEAIECFDKVNKIQSCVALGAWFAPHSFMIRLLLISRTILVFTYIFVIFMNGELVTPSTLKVISFHLESLSVIVLHRPSLWLLMFMWVVFLLQLVLFSLL